MASDAHHLALCLRRGTSVSIELISVGGGLSGGAGLAGGVVVVAEAGLASFAGTGLALLARPGATNVTVRACCCVRACFVRLSSPCLYRCSFLLRWLACG